MDARTLSNACWCSSACAKTRPVAFSLDRARKFRNVALTCEMRININTVVIPWRNKIRIYEERTVGKAHYIHAGRMRAKFRRKLGFPNLVLARAQRAELRARRQALIAVGYSKEEAKAMVKAGHNVARAKAAKTPEGRNLQSYLNSSRDL